jgi:hypothetical protein
MHTLRVVGKPRHTSQGGGRYPLGKILLRRSMLKHWVVSDGPTVGHPSDKKT